MNSSIAFGFYVRHWEAVDAIWNCEMGSEEEFDDSAKQNGLTDELLAAVQKNLNASRELVEQLEKDLEQFSKEIDDRIRKKIGKYTTIISGRPDCWGGRLKFTHKDGRTAKTLHDAELGWSLGTSEGKVYLRPWLWAKGGRATEEAIVALLSKWQANPELKTSRQMGEGWSHSGTVALGRIGCAEPCYRGKKLSDGLNTELIAEDMLKMFAWISQDRINRILSLGFKGKS